MMVHPLYLDEVLGCAGRGEITVGEKESTRGPAEALIVRRIE
jgi:hypothetical protein